MIAPVHYAGVVKQFVILKFRGFDSINDVEKYKQGKLLVTRDKAVRLDKDEYFVADMIGMKVVTDAGEDFGVLKEVLATGANDVYVVSREDAADVLLPAIKECIRNVDMDRHVMEIHVMDGLL